MLADDRFKPPTFVSTLKETNMKTKISLVILGLLVAFATTTLEAQNTKSKNGKRPQTQKDSTVCKRGELNGCWGAYRLPNVTESQKTEFKKLQTAFAQESLPLRNKADELRAKIKTQVSEGNEVTSELTNNITELNNNRTNIELLKAKEVMSIKALLTPEQKTVYNEDLRKMGDKRHFRHLEQRHDKVKGNIKESDKDGKEDDDDALEY